MLKKILILVLVLGIFSFHSCNQKKEYQEFYADGDLKVWGELMEEKKNGTWKYFDEDGKITHIREYVKGNLIHEKQLDSEGRIFLTKEYKNGIQNGKETGYYSDGSIRFERIYLNGLKEGESKSYYPNGKVFAKANYIQDSIRGEFHQYYLNGNIEVYAEDAGNSIHSFYDSLGSPTYEILFKNMKVMDTIKVY